MDNIKKEYPSIKQSKTKYKKDEGLTKSEGVKKNIAKHQTKITNKKKLNELKNLKNKNNV